MKRFMFSIFVLFFLTSAIYGGAVPPFTTIFMRTVLDDSTAAEGRATLGAIGWVTGPINSPNDAGNAGDVWYDSNYFYICVANNTWKRVALSSWGFGSLKKVDGGYLRLISGGKINLQ